VTNTLLEKALNELRTLILSELLGTGAEVFLYGSAASGGFSRTSDVDIAIEGFGKLPRGKLAHIREQVEMSHIPYRVEIVLLDEADEAFREKVRSEGIQWNGSESD
jgi:predicted nucleotidyltransferase